MFGAFREVRNDPRLVGPLHAHTSAHPHILHTPAHTRRPLPSPPSPRAPVPLPRSLSLHALFHLMGHWVIAFKAGTLFAPARAVDVGCSVLVVPPANRGKALLVPVGKVRLCCSYLAPI